MSDERPRLPYVSRKGHLKMIKLLFYPFLARPASVFFPTNHDFHCFPPDRMPPSAVTVGHAAIAGRYPAMPATIPNQPCQLPPAVHQKSVPKANPLFTAVDCALPSRSRFLDLLRCHLGYRRDHHATADRMPPTPTAVVADDLPLIFCPSLSESNFGRPKLQYSIDRDIHRTRLAADSCCRRQFRAEFEPVAAAVAIADHLGIFTVSGYVDPDHRQTLWHHRSPGPSGASTAAGEPPFWLNADHLWPRFRSSLPPVWSPSFRRSFLTSVVLRRAIAPEFPLRSSRRCSGVIEPYLLKDQAQIMVWPDPLNRPNPDLVPLGSVRLFWTIFYPWLIRFGRFKAYFLILNIYMHTYLWVGILWCVYMIGFIVYFIVFNGYLLMFLCIWWFDRSISDLNFKSYSMLLIMC